MPSAAAQTLADLARVFDALRCRWYLFGAQAAVHYGSPRLTADVDVTLELGDVSVSELLLRLNEVSIAPRAPLDEEFVELSRVLPLSHRPTGMAVDVVLAGPGLEDDFLSRATRLQFEDIEVPIATASDLVVMKTLAGRAKDLEDVAGIIRAKPEGLDLDRARGLLEALEESLGQSDLVPWLESAVARAG